MSRDRQQASRKQPHHADAHRVEDRRSSFDDESDENARHHHPSARTHRMYGAEHDEARQQIRELRSRY